MCAVQLAGPPDTRGRRSKAGGGKAGGGQRGRRRDRNRGGKGGKSTSSKGSHSAAQVESDDEDQQHFADVCYSLMAYGDDAAAELRWIEEAYQCVKDPYDRALLKPSVVDVLVEMRSCAEVNARFLAMLVKTDEQAQRYSVIPRSHHVQERNSVKVRTVLRQFVRDWAAEGEAERDAQYGVLLRALEKYKPLQGTEAPRVLTPGSGLSRLPFEVAQRGYSAQGNEFSYHMLQGSKWVLNETTARNTHTIYPFVLGLEHRKDARDHLRGITIPDVCPSQELCPDGVPGPQEFSMCAGEFVEVYSSQKGEWDAVLTCFFLDTAKNVFLYIRTIADILRPGGVWANIGPLLYHYAEQPDSISIELSWEEIRPAIGKYFDIVEEDVRQAYYTTNELGLFHTRYRCKFFVGIRNNTAPSGYSHPVF
mmetsp:Transcript_71121/g.164439  ORF Transcript_71121/g.164439 Transcript_71121/m.164439 type:complete len:421 (+) Transcript_71121:1151-2413(+)